MLFDALRCFRVVTASGVKHSAIIILNGGTGQEATQHLAFCAVITVLANLETAINGTYHALISVNTQTVIWPRFSTV
ncbi:hypothetical protein NTGM5_70140 [Candidatus Nitrotoga sp. M5]|nr:hypothetical protein NTGM5_70140 [Candidatus Nitrotoga sp. M5]